MTNEITKLQPNFYEAYGEATASRHIVGRLLKFSKFGEYNAGVERFKHPRPNTPERSPRPNALSDIELARVISLAEAARILGISKDGIRRHHAHLIRRLSPRRVGIRLGDVLSIGAA